MIVQRKTDEKLNSLVDLLWYVDENGLYESERNDIAMPTGHMHIVYNLADSYILINNKKSYVGRHDITVG